MRTGMGQIFYCSRHGDYSDNRVVSIGSRIGEDGEAIADQCADCIDECEAATW
ncbi:hypothetical protein SEA_PHRAPPUCCINO_192 [Mycobacterium phage Phrappuccino]|uniref:Uncharacterized protein n=1 Tax=Mycobacterium phage Phrappuccino TaxID=2591223 RepID=A0A514DE44_9CAUD|nr:hypothetical protein KHQ87_gp192 [Mycobacterium phage Phrappuccino]QDH91867.1 hypothetical protein SEA_PHRAPPUCCINO_192 [Mycobacterium phage Phrappuccino]QIQ63333.1 hypothetical protein SEA_SETTECANDELA_217 [Mycobacterium phage Settecandela]